MHPKPVQEQSRPVETARRQPASPTPTPLRPASGLLLGLLLSTVLWLALVVVWLAF